MAHQLPTLQFEEFVRTSERVKSIDVHSAEPWILASLYSGSISIWNYQSQEVEKSFKVTESPARAAKFIARKKWIVVGADDGFIRVYNYEKMEMISAFEAHSDYIRSLAVHPSLPYVLSASDDKLIKLWNWDEDWVCGRLLQGHDHYVMQLAFNPKDLNTFASASLDGTIKIWSVDSGDSRFALDGHAKGINCIDYFTFDNQLYLISGYDDCSVKIWDYENRTCVGTLEGHAHNVTAVCAPPQLPVIITCSEDETVRIWNKANYRLENTLNYGLGRVWAIGSSLFSNRLVFGCDNGTVMVQPVSDV